MDECSVDVQHRTMAHDLGDQLTVAGALRLARIVPVLEASSAPFVAEVVSILETRGRSPRAGVHDAANAIRRFRDAHEPTQDLESPPYLQAVAGGIALAVAGIGPPADRTRKIEYSTANFWDTCDHLVHRADGYRSPVFADLKTTLAGVEYLWQQRDAEALASGVSLAETFDRQLAKVHTSHERRRLLALAIARCAGWDTGQSE
jgi:hypothetical protein